MGDTTLAGTGGGAHAVEGGITHGPANAIHRRLLARRAGDHRAVRTLRRLAQDRLQVDRALPSPWAGGPGRTLASAAALARLRHPEPPRDGTDPTPPAAPRASGQADESDPGAQRHLERRLQGPVPDRRRSLLLSADRDRW